MKPIIPAPAREARRRPFPLRPFALTLLAALWLPGYPAAAQGGTSSTAPPDVTLPYPMDAASWMMAPPIGWAGRTAGAATFARDEGFPRGTMTLNEGIAVLNAGAFSTGQIDFDIKPIGYDDAGIIFHGRGQEGGEFVYVRGNPDCPAAEDCVQYAPITHHLMAWNIYPDYQGPAPISAAGWNHVTIQVADGKMRVYFNHAAEPSIVVARLLGLAPDGGIAFKGPAVYANLVVRPDARPDMSAVVAEPVQPGTLTAWLAAPPTPRNRTRPVSASDIPAVDAWHSIQVEPTGLVNLGRAFEVGGARSLSTGWLKTIVTASEPARRIIHLALLWQKQGIRS